MSEASTITGKIRQVLFRSESNSFTVLRFRLYELTEKDIFVTGYLPELPKDVLFEFLGTYIDHPKYGMQFSVESYRRMLPSDKESIVRYLSSPLFPGVGKTLAQRIVDTYGEDILRMIRDDPEISLDVQGMNPKKRDTIISGVCQQDNLEEAVRFFTTHGLGIRNIMKIDQIYGDKALDLISENPYRLIDEVDGIGFTTADKLALSMGFDTEHPLRKEAAIVSAIMDTCMSTGDSYTDIETLSYRCSRLFGEWLNDIDEVLNRLIDKEKVVDEEGKLYHFTQYKAENDIANFFVTFPLRTFDHSDKDVDELLNDFEARIGIEYDDIQRQAVLSFFEDDVMILTGGPGTGKTTIVQGIIDVCKKRYPSYEIVCCAPTGRAAKRMKEVTGNFATTIHALLKWNLETNTFGKNLADPLLADVLIIDEFSMVDSWLMAQLALASGYVRKILFIGDEDQLPSVACGSVLRDLIASNRFKTVRLQHIYRQKEGSDVIQLAQHIKEGHFDEAMCKNDVRFFASKPYDVKDLILRIVDEAMMKGYRIQDIQVLAAKYSGPAGIDALNHALQKLCNPPGKQKRELQVGYRLYREGDKILQLKNQPEDDVFNGDIGILVEIVYASEDENNQNRMFVDFDGIIVEYTPEWFINITHAYCISVHKAQGSEYPIVIMAAIMEYGQMLQRRLMYTGITRASRSLILVGQKTAFEKAVSTVDKDTRKTYLRQRLIEVLS